MRNGKSPTLTISSPVSDTKKREISRDGFDAVEESSEPLVEASSRGSRRWRLSNRHPCPLSPGVLRLRLAPGERSGRRFASFVVLGPSVLLPSSRSSTVHALNAKASWGFR
jgi:hypothetical protein